MSVELQPDPRPGQQCRKAEEEEPSRVRRYCAAYSQPQAAHGEYRDANRLEDCALLVLGPAANTAPDGGENAGKAGQAAQDPIQKAYAGIRCCTATLDGLHRRSGEAINAVEDKQRADRDANMLGPGPVENRNAQGDTKGCTEQEGPQPAPSQRVPQFPDRDALHDQTEGDDQRRGLDWRQDVQPDG